MISKTCQTVKELLFNILDWAPFPVPITQCESVIGTNSELSSQKLKIPLPRTVT